MSAEIISLQAWSQRERSEKPNPLPRAGAPMTEEELEAAICQRIDRIAANLGIDLTAPVRPKGGA